MSFLVIKDLSAQHLQNNDHMGHSVNDQDDIIHTHGFVSFWIMKELQAQHLQMLHCTRHSVDEPPHSL